MSAMQTPLKDASAPGTVKASECPNRREHTEGPTGYLAWHEWAEGKAKTHVQRRCPGCNLFAIWEPRATRPAPNEQEDEMDH